MTNNKLSTFLNAAFLNDVFTDYETTGRLLNDVLYNLCKSHFEHKTPDVIIAKTQLIGRTYAAALERRKKKQKINDNFYVDDVVPTFKNSELDERLKLLQRNRILNLNTVVESLKTHKYLTDILTVITDLEKRSFSSKYLHFHLPDLFFIYDSRAVKALGKLIKLVPKERLEHLPEFDKNEVNETYAKFALKCLVLKDFISEEIRNDITNRQLDAIFLKIANDELRQGITND